MNSYKILNTINTPHDLKGKTIEELKDLCTEIRHFLIHTISKTGGHLGANLGVVELTIALHYIFNAPNDKIIWDIGHQSYIHKILTNRKDKLHTVRQPHGLSGFANIFESEYDVFGAGHSSTSISAGLGIAAAMIEQRNTHNVIPIIGDSAISAGMAYEALNNAAEVCKNFQGKFIVILNDNNMSISHPTGALSQYLPKLYTSKEYITIKNFSKKILEKLHAQNLGNKLAHIAQTSIKNLVNSEHSENIFEAIGFDYIGPIDGHNLQDLTHILKNIKDHSLSNKPILLHLITNKGHGYKPAEDSADKFHGVSPFNIQSGQTVSQTKKTSYSDIFATTLTLLAKQDPEIHAITAAMPSGTGLHIFAQDISLKSRFWDTGIAEQHAVTFAAGLARMNQKPFCAIYSTFLQRAYDQLIHDVCIQNLPVRFMIDRAGLVGADGATHNGVFDAAFLRIIPNMVIISPANEIELQIAIKFAAEHNSSPIAVRYPRADVENFDLTSINVNTIPIISLGQSNLIRHGKNIAILSIGNMLTTSHKIANDLNATLIDLRFIKPLDINTILNAAKQHQIIAVIEESSTGGTTSAVLELLNNNNLFNDPNYLLKQFIPFSLPDQFFEHNTIANIHKQSSLDVQTITTTLQTSLFNL